MTGRNSIYVTSVKCHKVGIPIVQLLICTARMVVVCCLCRSLLQTKERRKLHSDSTKHVVPVLLEFAGSHGTQATRTVFHPQACLCRSCLRSIEKLQQLRDDLQAKENQIKQQMGRVLESHGLASADTHEEEPQQLHTPRKKRSAAEAEFESPCGVRTPKRRCYDTPTRESLKRVCPTGSSPAVAVSSQKLFLFIHPGTVCCFACINSICHA